MDTIGREIDRKLSKNIDILNERFEIIFSVSSTSDKIYLTRIKKKLTLFIPKIIVVKNSTI